MLVDVHCHMDDEAFNKDRDEVLERNKDVIVVNNGLNVESNRKVLSLCSKNRYAALGMYPSYSIELADEELSNEIEFIFKNKSKIIGIGEIGLDYYKVGEKEKQKKVFEQFLELASKIKKPVLVHSRRAEKDVIEILENYKLPVVLHCFNGSMNLVKRGIEDNFNFSVPVIVKRDKYFQKLVREINLRNILTETDSPYLGLGERNEPRFVDGSLKAIAEIKKLEKSFIENKVFENFSRIFLKEKGI